MNRTIAFLLAGGNGSRLGLLSDNRAKPVLPFGCRHRLIDFPLSNAANSGIREVGVLVQSKAQSIYDYIKDGESWGEGESQCRISLLSPGRHKYLGTADAVRKNEQFFDNLHTDTVLILSGDHIYQSDYRKLVAFHNERKADVTIAVKKIPYSDASQFGIAETDHQNRIIDWQEKPDFPKGNLASMGVYVFSKKYLKTILRQTNGTDFGKHVIPQACQQNRAFAYEFDGYWRDVGMTDSYWQAHMDILEPSSGLNLMQWNIYSKNPVGFRYDRPLNSYIANNAEIKGVVHNSFIFSGVRILENSVVRDSIILPNSTVYANRNVSHAIVDEGVVINSNIKMHKSVNVIGRETLTPAQKIRRVPVSYTLSAHSEMNFFMSMQNQGQIVN
jgi:glucose-1-phosphate adenylyltransferase